MQGSIFWGRYLSQKLLRDLDLRILSDLRSDLRGHPNPKVLKIVILSSLKDKQNCSMNFVNMISHYVQNALYFEYFSLDITLDIYMLTSKSQRIISCKVW